MRKAWRAAVWAAAALLLAAVGSMAQRYTFREYSEGLGNLNITCMTQDPTGYLWVGTENGLYRYDGSQFERYGAETGLPERVLVNLWIAPDGTLWVGASSGIYYRTQEGRFARPSSGAGTDAIPQNSGSMFTTLTAGRIVAATRGGAVELKHDSGNWRATRLALEGSSIWSVLYGADGALWYGCDLDLCRLAKGHTTRMRMALKMPEEQWRDLIRTPDGHIWVRGATHVGEVWGDGSRFQARELPGPAVSSTYIALTMESHGRVLTAKGGELALWEKDHWRMVTQRNGLTGLQLQSLFVDREGSVWTGVVGHGLMRWVGQDRWEGFTTADGLNDDLVWATMRDRQGRLWISTETGLDWIAKGASTATEWKAPGGKPVMRSVAVEQTTDDAIWVGSMAGTLTRIDAHTLTGRQWKVPHVFGLLADGPHRLWMTTDGGLYLLDPADTGRAPQRVEDPAFVDSKQRFTDLSLDTRGRLWLAGTRGFYVHDGHGWHWIDPGNSGARPDRIACDAQGEVWTAGPSQDLMRLRLDGYRVTTVQRVGMPPLLSQEIVSLMVDSRGWVWVGQDTGLSVYDGHRWRSFTQDDGLIWNDTDSFALNEDTDGSMWIGTSGGLSHLMDPKNAPAGMEPAPVFSQVLFGTGPLAPGASTEWRESPLTVSMALLSFKGTRNTGIRYRLVGEQGSGWETTHELTVRFRHLSPGNYRFEAATMDAAGNTISPISSFVFVLTPQWWQMRWLQAVGGMLVLLGVAWAWRRRVAQLMRQKEVLEDAVMLRTLDLEREKSELLRTREQMRHYAEHDDLTGIWNHRIVVQRLRSEVDRSRRDGTPVSVILADLDYFKKINDTFGHPAGDATLRTVSAIFQKSVRSYDWVGRYGGEEFLLILPGTTTEGAMRRAEEMRAAVEASRIVHDGRSIQVTASFGVASGRAQQHEAMIRAADTALYRAKKNGRNCVVVAEDEDAA